CKLMSDPNYGYSGSQAGFPGQSDSDLFNEPLLPAQYGSFWERLGAYIIDAIVVGIPTNIIASVLGLGATMRSIDPATGAVSEGFWAMYSSFLLVSIAISWLYFALMESSEKQAT